MYGNLSRISLFRSKVAVSMAALFSKTVHKNLFPSAIINWRHKIFPKPSKFQNWSFKINVTRGLLKSSCSTGYHDNGPFFKLFGLMTKSYVCAKFHAGIQKYTIKRTKTSHLVTFNKLFHSQFLSCLLNLMMAPSGTLCLCVCVFVCESISKIFTIFTIINLKITNLIMIKMPHYFDNTNSWISFY